MLSVRVLGPTEIAVDDERRPLGGPIPRALIVMLALREGGAVHDDLLLETAWGGNVPSSGRHALDVYVSNLRKAVAPAATIVRSGQGFTLVARRRLGDPRRRSRVRRAGRRGAEGNRRGATSTRLARRSTTRSRSGAAARSRISPRQTNGRSSRHGSRRSIASCFRSRRVPRRGRRPVRHRRARGVRERRRLRRSNADAADARAVPRRAAAGRTRRLPLVRPTRSGPSSGSNPPRRWWRSNAPC